MTSEVLKGRLASPPPGSHRGPDSTLSLPTSPDRTEAPGVRPLPWKWVIKLQPPPAPERLMVSEEEILARVGGGQGRQRGSAAPEAESEVMGRSGSQRFRLESRQRPLQCR